VNTKLVHALAGLLAMSALTGCQKPAAPASDAPVPASAAPAPAATPAQGSARNVTFAVTPATVSGCNGAAPIVAEVKWSVQDIAGTEVKVEVKNKDQEPQLLSIGGRTGQARTGAWVVSGTRFRLVDNTSGQELATHEMTAEPCR
jgi:hypothetical protein